MRAQAFSLIELMVVIAIVAILAAVAVPAYSEYIQRSKIGAATQIVTSFGHKLMAYYDTQGAFPTTISQLGYTSSDPSLYPATMPSSLGEYAVSPYVVMIGFNGHPASAGNCARATASMYVSNVGNGAWTTSNTTPDIFFIVYDYIATSTGVWQVGCMMGNENHPSTDGNIMNNINPNCYDHTSVGTAAYNTNVIAPLLASCT